MEWQARVQVGYELLLLKHSLTKEILSHLDPARFLLILQDSFLASRKAICFVTQVTVSHLAHRPPPNLLCQHPPNPHLEAHTEMTNVGALNTL